MKRIEPEVVKEGTVTFGKAKFINDKTQDEKIWLKMFVPLYLDGKPVTYDEAEEYLETVWLNLYSNNENVGDAAIDAVSTELDGEKGVVFTVDYQGVYEFVVRNFQTDSVKIDSVELELEGKLGNWATANKLELAATPLTTETFEFNDENQNPINTLSPSFDKDTYSYTLTLDDITWPLNYNLENNSNNMVSIWFHYGKASVNNLQTNQKEFLYKDTEKKELTAYLLPFNSKPLLYEFDLKGNSLLTGDDILEYSASITGRYFYQTFSDLENKYKTIKEIKDHNLDFDKTTYTIGETGDGSPIEISLQELIEKVYGSNPVDTTDISSMNVVDMKTWFSIFGFNPYTDTMNEKIVVKPVLTGIPTYGPREVSVKPTKASGSLSKITLQNTNNEIEKKVIDITSADTDITVSVPYTEVSISTSSTSNYDCVMYDTDGTPLDEKAFILNGDGTPTDFAIVVGKVQEIPNIYKVHLKYEFSPTPENILLQKAPVQPQKTEDIKVENVQTPDTNIKEENVQTPDTNIKEENVQTPDTNIKEENVQTPDVDTTEENVQTPDTNIKEENVQTPDADIKEENVLSPDADMKEEKEPSPDMDTVDTKDSVTSATTDSSPQADVINKPDVLNKFEVDEEIPIS